MKLTLLKEHNGKDSGTVLEVENDKDDVIAKGLIASGIAEEFNEDESELKKALDELVDQKVKEILAKEAKALAKGARSPVPASVEVHENWEDDAGKGFKSFGYFAKDVYAASTGQYSKHLIEYNKFTAKAFGDGQNESIGADGGFLVPEGFNPTIREHPMVNPFLDLTSFTSIIPIVGNSMKTVVLNNADQSGTSRFGGIVASFFKEGSVISSTKFNLKTVTQVLDDLGALVFVTNDLLEDSAIALESYLSSKAGAAIMDVKNEAIIRGDGTEEPLGFIGNSGTVEVTRDGADAVSIGDVVTLVARSTNRMNSMWIINQELYPTIAQLKLGDVRALVPTALDGVTIDTLQGRPVVWTDLASAIGDAGDISFVDLSGYQTLLKNNGVVKVDSSIHLKFDSVQTAFRFVTRMAGQPLFDTKITPKFGTEKLSAFVTLDTNP